MSKVEKTTGLLHELQAILPNFSPFTFYKAFIRPNLDNRDIIHDQVYNESFHQKLESIQYNAALTITRSIKDKKTLSRTRLRISSKMALV